MIEYHHVLILVYSCFDKFLFYEMYYLYNVISYSTINILIKMKDAHQEDVPDKMSISEEAKIAVYCFLLMFLLT